MQTCYCEADTDFRWAYASSDRHLVALSRNCEYVREKLLRIDPAIKLPKKGGPKTDRLLFEHFNADQGLGLITGVWLYVRDYWTDFPSKPFEEIRTQLLARCEAGRKAWIGYKGLSAAENLASSIAGFPWGAPVQQQKVEILAPADATNEELITLLLEAPKKVAPSQKRGAGSPIRQHKTDLKYLAAARLLKREAEARGAENETRFVADAMVLSKEKFGKALLCSEAKWLRAKARVDKAMADFDPEIRILRLVNFFNL
jgi:hypothetical protein